MARGDVIASGKMMTIVEGCKHTPRSGVLVPAGVELDRCERCELEALEATMDRAMQRHMNSATKCMLWLWGDQKRPPPYPATWSGGRWRWVNETIAAEPHRVVVDAKVYKRAAVSE